MGIIRDSFGRFETVGNPREADVVVAFSIGTDVGLHSVNHELAYLATRLACDRPLLVDLNIYAALPNDIKLSHADTVHHESPHDAALPHIVQLEASDPTHLDDAETLDGAYRIMDDYGLRRPMLVAQAQRIGRIARRASRAGMTDPIIPAGLPRRVDHQSAHWSDRSKLQTAAREVWFGLHPSSRGDDISAP